MEVTAASKGTPGACAACGDMPVMHSTTYALQTIEVWLSDKTQRLGSGLFALLTRLLEPLADAIADGLPRVAYAVGIFRVSNDPERACSYRSQVIWEDAQHRGIEMQQIKSFGYLTEMYRARINGRWIYFQSLPIPRHLSRHTYQGIDDKLLLKRFLRERGIPVTDAALAKNLIQAHAIFERMHKPVVVKPRIGSRARHTTTNIHTTAEIDAAFKSAQVLCRDVLLEEHLEGPVSRATVVAGRLIGFLQMFPARVIGDGIHTIQELVDMKNRTRPERVQAITLDQEHRSYLARSGYTPDSIPERDTDVILSRRTGRFEGGRTKEMPQSIHPKLRAYVERAANELQVPVVGFDIIIADPESDPDMQRWGMLEANSLPYIDLHYAPLEGEATNVAAAVWDLWNVPAK